MPLLTTWGAMPGAIDPERLAALLDDRLPAAERSALIAELAAADDDVLRAYADAAAVSAGIGNAATAPPLRAPVWRRASTLAIAASALLAVGIGFTLREVRGQAVDPGMYANAVRRAPAADALPIAWSEVRGGGETARPQAMAVRAGALMIDLAFAERRGGDSTVALASHLANHLHGISGGGAAAALYERVAASGGAGGASELRVANVAATGVLDASLVRAGAWLEAARGAAVERDTQFFGSGDAPQALDAVVPLLGTGAARASLDQLRSELRAPVPDWPKRLSLVVEVLRAAAR